jgi:hypothetical protein
MQKIWEPEGSTVLYFRKNLQFSSSFSGDDVHLLFNILSSLTDGTEPR